MKVSYSKKNELKQKLNSKDWNNPEIQAIIYMELDKAKSEGFAEALEMMDAEKIVSNEDKINQFKNWLYEREAKWDGNPEEQYATQLVIDKFEEICL